MNELLAYRNGQLIEADQLSIPATDMGFAWGVTVAEQLRTFAGKLFRCEQHLQRLIDSASAVGTPLAFSKSELEQQATQLIERNLATCKAGSELSLVIFATPGSSSAMGESESVLGMHTYPVPLTKWANQYDSGASLLTSSIRQIVPENWSPNIKCRSRMHYFLADQEVKQQDEAAWALMLDQAGFICESPIANVLAVFDNKLVSPRKDKILPGVSLGFVEEISAKLGLEFSYRDISTSELVDASEALLTSTSFCILPVTQLDGSPIGDGKTGTGVWKTHFQVEPRSRGAMSHAYVSMPTQAWSMAPTKLMLRTYGKNELIVPT